MFKKEVVFILVSLFIVIGAGCQKSFQAAVGDCDVISDPDKKIQCEDNIYFQEKDCDKIINNEIRESCITGSSALDEREVAAPFGNEVVVEFGEELPPKPE